MKVRKTWIGSNQPATQGNLADLQEDIHIDIDKLLRKQDTLGAKQDRLEVKQDRLETKQDKTIETLKTILDIVKDNDRKLTKLQDIPERVSANEHDILKLKLRN